MKKAFEITSKSAFVSFEDIKYGHMHIGQAFCRLQIFHSLT